MKSWSATVTLIGLAMQNLAFLDKTVREMEFPVIYTGNFRVGDLLRLQRQLIQCCSRAQVLLRDMESIGGIFAYYCKKNFDDFIFVAPQECNRKICSCLFGRHGDYYLCSKIWRR
ncbi:hypothetical protein AYI70_g10825 [Smittium culicis]|uniref:Uncharacterized protein n=1 Tax=Smittium culicis TaxID=133412 RepID=A0A1R1X4Q0_9FUNG|nr:hypothetical protein AYI70_g10825 [Smittium culicis]